MPLLSLYVPDVRGGQRPFSVGGMAGKSSDIHPERTENSVELKWTSKGIAVQIETC